MLNEDNCEIETLWQCLKKTFEGVKAACRRSYADNRKRRLRLIVLHGLFRFHAASDEYSLRQLTAPNASTLGQIGYGGLVRSIRAIQNNNMKSLIAQSSLPLALQLTAFNVRPIVPSGISSQLTAHGLAGYLFL
jgi:hypothetical protein